MKTEELITDIDKKIAHFLNRSTESSLAEDFEAIKSYVRAVKVLTEARMELVDSGKIRFKVKGSVFERNIESKVFGFDLRDREPILVYECREEFARKCVHHRTEEERHVCVSIKKPFASECVPTPEHCPRLRP